MGNSNQPAALSASGPSPEPQKHGDRAFPMKALALCAGLTLALPALGAWNAWTLHTGFGEMASDGIRLMQLNGEILHLDEVLTSSALMAAATGNPRWEQRYRHFDPVLVTKINEAIVIAPEAYGQGAKETEQANTALVALQNDAFERVRNGDLAGATRVLQSGEYEHYKRVYALGMERSRQAAAQRIRDLVAGFNSRAVQSWSIGLAVLLLLCGSWLHIVLLIVRHLRARGDAEVAVHEANSTLESKVADRTAALANANEVQQESLDNLRRTQRELIAVSRRAGMADVAVAVLHNVGNVLNSVNVSSALAADLVRRSMVSGFHKATRLIQQHQHEIGSFLTTDERGKHLPAYLVTLSEHVQKEQLALLKELESVQQNIDHIKTIVARQQEHAKPAESPLEVIRPDEVADEAIALVKRACDQQKIVFERDYAQVGEAMIDRHLTLQIVVNLLNNARQALAVTAGKSGIVVRVQARDGDRFSIEVEDEGCGIATEDIGKLFQHGFTTKHDGHGLGLHSSACMAEEMGGSLTAASDGLGHGARFTLVLPLRPGQSSRKTALAGAPMLARAG